MPRLATAIKHAGLPDCHGLGMNTFDAAPADPLNALTDAECLTLARRAYRILITTLPLATAALLRRGKCRHLIAAKMRVLLAQNKKEYFTKLG